MSTEEEKGTTPEEVEGASVGALGHIYKKTFKELYFIPTEPEEENKEENDQEVENVEEQTEPPPSTPNVEEERGEEGASTGPEEADESDLANENAMEDNASVTSNKSTVSLDDSSTCSEIDLEKEYHEPQVSLEQQAQVELDRIAKDLEKKEVHATKLTEFLEDLHKKAEEVDEQSAKDLYEQGLVLQAEYPLGPSMLSIPTDQLANFGEYGAHLILSENLMEENEFLDRYKRGQVESRGLDKAYQIRPSTPNYLKSTKAQEVRLEISEKSRNSKPVRPKKARTSRSYQLLDKQSMDGDALERRLGESPKEKFLKSENKNREEKLTTEQIRANEKILKRMQNQLDFLRNPRYNQGNKVKKKKKPLSHLMLEGIEQTVPEQPEKIQDNTCFYVPNGKATFTDYRIGGVYETSVKLHNVSNISRRVRVLPPTSRFFSISLIAYPSDSGTVAPGMACVIKVKFCPESLGDYNDYITVLTETNDRFRVPIVAFREPPSLSIPPELDCGCCLGGNRKSVVFHCANMGGPGRFRLLPTSDWPNPSSQSLAFRSVDIAPFRISPAEFSLDKGESIELKVDFSPQGSGWGDLERSFVMVCDNCQVKHFKVKGTSCYVTIEVAALGSTLIDLTTPYMKEPESLSFNRVTVGKAFERMVRIKNTTPISLKFHWAVYVNSPLREVHGSQRQNQRSRSSGKRKLVPVHLLPNAKDIFTIRPLQGSFSACGSVEFTISFRPRKAEEYMQQAKLVIEDIPPSSVKGFVVKSTRKKEKRTRARESEPDDPAEDAGEPRKALLRGPSTRTLNRGLTGGSAAVNMNRNRMNLIEPLSFPKSGSMEGDNAEMQSQLSEAESQVSSSRTEQEEGMEVKLMNIPCLKLGLQGVGEHPLMDIQPRFVKFPGTLVIHNQYTESVELTNKSAAEFSFDWGGAMLLQHELPEPDGREVSEPTGPLFSVSTSCTSGTLSPGESIIIDIELKVHKLGFIDLMLPCSYTNGPENGICVRIQADIAGPIVELCSPEIDFGLVAVNEQAEVWLPFKNLSEVPIEYIFEEHGPLDNIPRSQGEENTGASSSAMVPASPSNYRSSMSMRSLVSSYTVAEPVQEWCELSFAPCASGKLGPLERRSIQVTCKAGGNPERLRKFLVCKVLDGPSQYIGVRGEIQSPKVHIDTHGFELGTTYVTVPVVRTITITNLSNLQAPFKWSEVGDPKDAYTVTFDPSEGVLGAKSQQRITATFVSNKPGRVSSLFACDVEGIKRPIGVFLKTVSRGLVVTYSLVGPEVEERDMYPLQPKDGDVSSATTSTKIPILDFGDDVELCTRQRVRLCLQNHSAIPTSYDVFIKDFAAKCLPLSLGGKTMPAGAGSVVREGSSRDRTSSNPTGPSGGGGLVSLGESRFHGDDQSIQYEDDGGALIGDETKLLGTSGNRMVLSDRHEATDIFKSEAGIQFINQKIQSREDRNVLGRDQGVAFLALKPKGLLAPWKAVIIDIVCFNNLPGRYKDELVCNVEGVSQSRVPIKVRVDGCPLTLSRNTVGLNLNSGICPQLDYGDIVRSTDTVHKVIKVVNSGPMDAHVTWRIEADRSPDADVVQLSLQLNKARPVKGMTVADFEFVKVSIKLHDELTNVPPFEVQPYQQRVRAFGEAKFRVSYAVSDNASLNKAVMVADGDWLSSGLHQSASTPAVMTTAVRGKGTDKSSMIVLSESKLSSGGSPEMLVGEAVSPQLGENGTADESGTPGPENPGDIDQRKDSFDSSDSRNSAPVANESRLDNTSSNIAAVPLEVGDMSQQTPTSSTHVQSAATMPNPHIDSSISLPGRDSNREPMKNCLRLGLSASSIVPKLSLDCPFREDGFQYINYTVWSTTPTTHDSYFKTLTLTNREGAWLMCAFAVDSPGYEIFRIESNAERPSRTNSNLHKLLGIESRDLIKLGSSKEKQEFDPLEGMNLGNVFNLAPGTSVTVTIRFTPSNYHARALDPNQQIIQKENGALLIKFVNGEVQKLCLEGIILQPMLIADPPLVEFGRVHVDCFARTTISITNHTPIEAVWKLEHVPKQASGVIDDPSCWQFSPDSSKLPGHVLPISCALACPPMGYDEGGKRKVLAVTVQFRPNQRGYYQSRFCLSVENGRSVEVLLRGFGSYEEEDDHMVKRLPVPPTSFEVDQLKLEPSQAIQMQIEKADARSKRPTKSAGRPTKNSEIVKTKAAIDDANADQQVTS